MQPRAWYFRTASGMTYGPSYTMGQAQMEAARLAVKRPKLEPETALILWRSLARRGWKIGHTHTKDIAAPVWLRQPS